MEFWISNHACSTPPQHPSRESQVGLITESSSSSHNNNTKPSSLPALHHFHIFWVCGVLGVRCLNHVCFCFNHFRKSSPIWPSSHARSRLWSGAIQICFDFQLICVTCGHIIDPEPSFERGFKFVAARTRPLLLPREGLRSVGMQRLLLQVAPCRGGRLLSRSGADHCRPSI